jgi:hypothetical protein
MQEAVLSFSPAGKAVTSRGRISSAILEHHLFAMPSVRRLDQHRIAISFHITQQNNGISTLQNSASCRFQQEVCKWAVLPMRSFEALNRPTGVICLEKNVNQLALIRLGSIEIEVADHKTDSRMPEIEPVTERRDKGQESKRVAGIHGRQVLDHL